MRARKLRMTGGGIAMPTHRSEEGIKKDWNVMIKDGELCLGELNTVYRRYHFILYDKNVSLYDKNVSS